MSKSLVEIHGISRDMLSGAPSLKEVVKHIRSLLEAYRLGNCDTPVLVGHSLAGDIDALGLDKVDFIDTTNFRFKSD